MKAISAIVLVLGMIVLGPHTCFAGYCICVDPGHGGAMPGAVCGGVNEKALNLSVALELEAKLDYDGNYWPTLTRTTDEDVSFQRRVQHAQDEYADIFLSIHHNSPGATSTLAFWCGADSQETYSDASIILAIDVSLSVKSYFSDPRYIIYGGVKNDPVTLPHSPPS